MTTTLLLLSLGTSAVAQTTPDTGEEKFVRLTHQLESSPLSDSDKSIRGWLLQWATDSQDISVVICDVMDFISDGNTPNAGIYTTQMMFGNAAFQISNSDKRNDILATQMAGVRSALKAYQSLLAKDQKARILHFDDLLKKDQDGSLENYLAPVVEKKCSESGGA